MSHSNVLKYVSCIKQYEAHHENRLPLHRVFHTALSLMTTYQKAANMPELHPTLLIADWMKACDVQMGELRSLGCWEVLPRSSLPRNA